METEKDKLMPLPDKRYEFKSFAFPTVGVNYHIYLSEDSHYYSVPYRTGGKKVKVIYSSTAVEIYYDNRRIASHMRDRTRGGYTTKKTICLLPTDIMQSGTQLGLQAGQLR